MGHLLTVTDVSVDKARLALTMRKHQESPHGAAVYHTTGLLLSNTSTYETQRKDQSCSGLKGNEQVSMLNAMPDSRRDPGPEKQF